jgi:hypothetical protein
MAWNCGENWRQKPHELTQLKERGIKLKMTATGGGEWQKSWPINLGAAGGGGRFHKPAKTSSVLNGGFGSGKRGFSRPSQKGGFWNFYRHELR